MEHHTIYGLSLKDTQSCRTDFYLYLRLPSQAVCWQIVTLGVSAAGGLFSTDKHSQRVHDGAKPDLFSLRWSWSWGPFMGIPGKKLCLQRLSEQRRGDRLEWSSPGLITYLGLAFLVVHLYAETNLWLTDETFRSLLTQQTTGFHQPKSY